MKPERKILIIEHDELLARLLETKLMRLGHKTEVCFNLGKGTIQFNNWAPDAVVLETVLSGANFSVVRQIREVDPMHRTKIIILNANDDKTLAEHAKKAGGDVFIGKTESTIEDIVESISE
jgi:DNA-binding response OmpR family regulator